MYGPSHPMERIFAATLGLLPFFLGLFTYAILQWESFRGADLAQRKALTAR